MSWQVASIKRRSGRVIPAIIVPALFVFIFGQSPRASTQKMEPKRLKKAVERSEKSAAVLKTIAELPHGGIPGELIGKAEAIGVFPHVVKTTLIFNQMTLGYGVISRRKPEGWSLPAYYVFMGAGYALDLGSEEKADIILLLMDEKALSWFQKGGVKLKGEKKAVAGPVGIATDEQKAQLANADVISYALHQGILIGSGLSGGFFKSFLIDPDNNINKPLYGMKGREVLAGKEIDPQSVPAGINSFQQALNKHYPRPTRAFTN